MNALAMTCSACNPLLYTLFSKRFRARVARLISCGTYSDGLSCNNRTCEITYNFTNTKFICKFLILK